MLLYYFLTKYTRENFLQVSFGNWLAQEKLFFCAAVMKLFRSSSCQISFKVFLPISPLFIFFPVFRFMPQHFEAKLWKGKEIFKGLSRIFLKIIRRDCLKARRTTGKLFSILT